MRVPASVRACVFVAVKQKLASTSDVTSEVLRVAIVILTAGSNREMEIAAAM